MKKTIYAAALLLAATLWCAEGLQPRPCCREGLMRRRGCLDGQNVSLECPHIFMLEQYNVTEDGLTTLDTPGYVWSVDEQEFCVGRMERNQTGVPQTVDVALVCYAGTDGGGGAGFDDIQIYGVLVLLSAIFLVLTLWVYFLLPQLRDLQGKCIMCQSVCLAMAFLNLGVMQLGAVNESAVLVANCSVNSFMMYFWFMAMFFWSNVVSINIFRSVSQYKHLSKTASSQFLYYSAYAWGSAFAFLMVALITNFIEGPHIKPHFGEKENQCWFTGVLETWAFFYGPIAVLIVVNIVMFLLASRLLWTNSSYHHEVSVVDTLKYRFSLYMKLFIVTGISWIFEVAGFAHMDKSLIIWRIADIFNCVQGILFFLLLVVFRRRALKGLQERGLEMCGLVPLLLKCFSQDKESDLIVESDEQEHEQVEAPFNVNLN